MAPSVRAALGGSNSSRACGMGCVAAACVRPTINAFRAVGERSAEGSVKARGGAACSLGRAGGCRGWSQWGNGRPRPGTAAGLSVGGATVGFRRPKTRKIAAGSLLRSRRLTGAALGGPKSSSTGVPG